MTALQIDYFSDTEQLDDVVSKYMSAIASSLSMILSNFDERFSSFRRKCFERNCCDGFQVGG